MVAALGHSNLYSAVPCIWPKNIIDNTLVFWLLLNSVKAFSLLLASRLGVNKKLAEDTGRTADPN